MRFFRRFGPYILMILMLALGGLIWWNREFLRDWWILNGYDAPKPIVQLATDTAMSSYGERLFLVNKPELSDKTTFNKNCEGLGEEAAVLGCYRGNRLGIYLYDITDPRLNGVEQVTAAHEMLHQAYDRLDDDEREHIDNLLDEYYRTKLTDQSVKDKMELYKKSEPNDLKNEMHSIFGTEIKDLPEELETYYARYFTDRSKVLQFDEQSQAEFDKYRKQIADLDANLADMKTRIDNYEVDLTRRSSEIKTKKSQMDSDLAAGKVAEYNAAVSGYNKMVQDYNRTLAEAKALIEEYNRLVKERNALAVQAKSLNEALDSRLSPQ